jgi:hypothetical protein
MHQPKIYFLLIILLLPLLFINVKNSHDWGDDFAQYLIQSRNIVEHRAQSENGLVLNEGTKAFAITAYPVGYPLLISPVFFFYKLNPLPYDILTGILLLITGILLFDFLQDKIHLLTALLLAILFCYNPHIIDFKKYILSEIPFICAILLFLKVNSNDNFNKYRWIYNGILLSVIVSIRLAGIAIVSGYMLYCIYNIIVSDKKTYYLKIAGKEILLGTLFFIGLNKMVFDIHLRSLFHFYEYSYSHEPSGIAANITMAYKLMSFVFPLTGSWMGSSWILLSIFGWLIHLIKKNELIDFLSPAYAILILIYPYQDGGIRFLLPLFPFIFFYLIYFLSVMLSFILRSGRFYEEKRRSTEGAILTNHHCDEHKIKYSVINIFIFILLIGYLKPVNEAIASTNTMEEGPYQEKSIELWNYLKQCDTTTVMVFCKARVMSLYSGHPTYYPPKKISDGEILSAFSGINKLRVILARSPDDTEIYDHRLTQLISDHKEKFSIDWQNEKFVVFSKKN